MTHNKVGCDGIAPVCADVPLRSRVIKANMIYTRPEDGVVAHTFKVGRYACDETYVHTHPPPHTHTYPQVAANTWLDTKIDIVRY